MRITSGKFYLFEERVPLRTHQILRRELSAGRETLYISKHSPQQLRSQFDFDSCMLQTMWLSPRPEDNCIPPMNLRLFEESVSSFLEEYPNGIVALNGLDVLEMWNGFRPVRDVLQRTCSHVNANGNNLIVSLDPKNLNHRTVAELEKLSDVVISSTPEAATAI